MFDLRFFIKLSEYLGNAITSSKLAQYKQIASYTAPNTAPKT